ncbi:MAG: ABC transporter substrate-binding protein [Candidatus Limnocylindria bacterium]
MRDIKVLGMIMAASLVFAACAGPTGAPATTAPATGSPAATTPAAGELPEPEITTLRIGISTPNEPVQFAQKLADSLGLYQKYGFTNVTVTGFEGDGRALQALIAGQLDMFVGGASTTISSVVSDTPLKLVAMNSTVLTDGLWCTSDITTPEDVRGKGIAISTFGGTSHGASLLLVRGLGFTANDVVITQVGNQGTRIAALRGGSVGCAVVDMSQEEAMREAGMNLLFDLSTAELEWGRSGFQAQVEFIEQNPNTVLVAVAAALEAQNSMWTDPETAAKHFAEFAQIPEEDALSAIMAFQEYGSRSMQFTESAFEAPKEVLASQNPAVADADISQAYDLSFLERLEEIGFYEKIGAPTD